MRRLVALTVAIALATSTSSALAARPVGILVDLHPGVYRVEYWVANGPEPVKITEAEYRDFVRTHSCGPRSHVAVWEKERVVQVVCEL
ncbi:MAG: hypothetical protein JWN27_2881 [Candidatus Eremiobacteraeota bacterium]|nr:hypothetical protein [Candidatus Eremiobacteraeota bacterium]